MEAKHAADAMRIGRDNPFEEDDRARAKEVLVEQAAILAELHERGYSVANMRDLPRPLPVAAVEVLVRHIDGAEDPPNLKRAVLSLLAYRGTPDSVRVRFLDAFRREPPPNSPSDYRWIVAEMLRRIGPGPRAREYVELAGDESFGEDRGPLVAALADVDSPEAVQPILRALERDDSLQLLQAGMEAVRKSRLLTARGRVEKLLMHANGETRADARRTIAVLDRAAARAARRP